MLTTRRALFSSALIAPALAGRASATDRELDAMIRQFTSRLVALEGRSGVVCALGSVLEDAEFDAHAERGNPHKDSGYRAERDRIRGLMTRAVDLEGR